MYKATVGVSEAKNRLSQLLDRVEAGETIAITRHGKRIALLTPLIQDRPSARQAIKRLRELQQCTRLGGLSIRELRDRRRP
jgi:prevent-host-death family protein